MLLAQGPSTKLLDTSWVQAYPSRMGLFLFDGGQPEA